MKKIKVLFVCIHNSARSQMAEAFLDNLGGQYFIAESAGLEPGKINPIVTEIMNEIGYDFSNKKTKSVFDFFKEGRIYNFVITVCDESQKERCPVFPSHVQRLHWSFRDPSSLSGSREDVKQQTRMIRDQIKEKIIHFIEDYQDYIK